MNVLVAAMVEQGLLTRNGRGGRGRRTGIALTDRGREALQRAWPVVQEFNSPTALGLTPAEATALDESLTRIRQAYE